MPAPARGYGAAQRRHHATDAAPSPTGSKERSTTGSLLVTAVGRGAVADLRRQRQAAVAAAGAAVLVTTTASSASTLQGISHARTVCSGGAGWPGCSASKACQQNEKAQHTSIQCRRIARSLLTWKSAQPSSSQPIWSVAGQRVVVGPSPVRRVIPCLTEVGPRGVESQRRWRILSTPDLGAGRVSRTRSASTTARRRQPSASWPRDVGVTVAARQYLVA